MWRGSMKPVPHCDPEEQKGDGGHVGMEILPRPPGGYRIEDHYFWHFLLILLQILRPRVRKVLLYPTPVILFVLIQGAALNTSLTPWAVVSNISVRYWC